VPPRFRRSAPRDHVVSLIGQQGERQPFWVTLSASAVRALPFGRYRAATALARFSRRPFVSRLPEDLGGAAFTCDLGDSIAREVCFTGRYEPQETQIARRLLQPGMSAVDVGANWGYFTLVAAHLVGARGRVLALEPDPGLFRLLSGNASRNGLAQITCANVAAADVAGRARFVAAPSDGGNSGLARLAAANERSDFECTTAALDDLLREQGVEHVDLVKIDVEGAETRVLRGMLGGLRAGRYRYVLLECHPAALEAAGSSMADCLEILRSSGYRGWQIDHSPSMHRRAATGAVPLADMLAPLDAALDSHGWPHFVWAAPRAPLLV
jgi:FkbM family methyltransferase